MTSYALGPLAQEEGLKELGRDPALVMAAILLITVCIAWIIVARLITSNLRRAALRRKKRRGPSKPDFKMWSDPP